MYGTWHNKVKCCVSNQRLFTMVHLIWGSSWRRREQSLIASDSICALFMSIHVWKIIVYGECTRKIACIPSRTEKIRVCWLNGFNPKARTKSITLPIVWMLAHTLYLNALYILGNKSYLTSRSWFFQIALSILRAQYSSSDVAMSTNNILYLSHAI